MSDSKIKDLEKTVSLKVQEIDSLKAQNGRLIERLQEEIDKSSSSLIQKEIIHKEILQIHMSLREVYQQGQVKKSVLEKIFNKINEFEVKMQEQQKISANKYGKYVTAAVSDEMEHLKMEVIKVQAKETNIEKLLLETNEQIQEQKQQIKATQLAINTILKHSLKKSISDSALISETSDDSFISDSDVAKISLELKNELSNNKDDLNLILQMITEKNE